MTDSEREQSGLADDPIVAQVREQRDAIAAAVNYDLDALVARLQSLEESERNSGRRIVPGGGNTGAAA